MSRFAIRLLVSAALLATAPTTAAPRVQETAKDPDRLYADREHLQSAFEAASLWETRLRRDPNDFESAWKLAKAGYWLGGHAPADERRKQYERGIQAATRATAIRGDRPEGHFWLAANMGAMAESFGLRAGIKYRGPVKKELETVLMIDRGFQQGSADRALGRWYLKVPRLFGGSKDKSVEHLRKSLSYDPDSLASHYFLAETYLEMDRRDEARREAQKVLDSPIHAEWAPEDREFKQQAKALLERLR
ncbi:MAG TPA: TRAP transporter TatT component family protein [Vicinamibacterales bacterium]|nr:TRAP transporter TatT component family protein [Vicinamibacterales bacterium]